MSSRRPIRTKELQNPNRIQSNLIRDYVDGNLDDYTFLYRASVVKIDQLGGALEENPPNPKNSIKARIITNARDKDLDDDELSVFWPLFPHDVMPIKEGEHVYVLFEDSENKTHGLWIARIPEPSTTDNPNLTPGIKKYQNDSSNDFSEISAEQSVQDTDTRPTTVDVSSEFSSETVPKFRPRIGDRVIEGSNNSLIVLSRDRITDPASGEKELAGTIDIVAGRSIENDVDLSEDKSRIYVTMKSDVDGNFDINVGKSTGPAAHIVLKSDEIRIVARNGMKLIADGGHIVIQDGDMTIEGGNIFIGQDASEASILGDSLKSVLEQILDAITQMTVTTAVGPSSPPVNAAQFVAIKQTLDTILSKTVKVKS